MTEYNISVLADKIIEDFNTRNMSFGSSTLTQREKDTLWYVIVRNTVEATKTLENFGGLK